ncbi:hypothetical protein FGB62_18g213 [Gracilaria domingensis]|nr:hypothetical protein FGB62_18g213 [Gracilaria domingensis]
MFRALAENYGNANPDPFQTTQVEIIFDTSKEWDMSTPVFMKDSNTKRLDLVLFMMPSGMLEPRSAMYTSSNNSCNIIPDWANVEVIGTLEALTEIERTVPHTFKNFTFDDPQYGRGVLFVDSETDSSEVLSKAILIINVESAQHGSVPDQNRLYGVNPFVSLANFVAGLYDDRTLGANAVSSVAKFIKWTWGTYVFGYKQESLNKYDEIFQENNGTTYGVTKSTMEEDGSLKLETDIRYAFDHHSIAWEGVTEGALDGKSVFSGTFARLLEQFNQSHTQLGDVSFTQKTVFRPDIRVPETNENYLTAEEAFRKVMKTNAPRLAIGGGTDAKGNLSLLAMCPLFGTNMGNPINYHDHLQPVRNEVLSPSAARLSKAARLKKHAEILATLNKIAARGAVGILVHVVVSYTLRERAYKNASEQVCFIALNLADLRIVKRA